MAGRGQEVKEVSLLSSALTVGGETVFGHSIGGHRGQRSLECLAAMAGVRAWEVYCVKVASGN